MVYANALGLELVPNSNWHNLGSPEDDTDTWIERAHAKIRRLRALGVRQFQIDAACDGVFYEAEAEG